MSRTISASSVVISRSTPCVAGWCGPKLIVSSSSDSGARCGRARRLLHLAVRDVGQPCAPSLTLPPLRRRALVVREQDRLAADREVAPLRMALVVLGHEDPAQVGVAVEDHAEHVVDLALLVVGRRPGRRHARHVRVGQRHARAHGDAVDLVHVEQLVVDAEARLLREVVDAVDRGEEAVALGAQVLERRRHRARARRAARPARGRTPCRARSRRRRRAAPARSARGRWRQAFGPRRRSDRRRTR